MAISESQTQTVPGLNEYFRRGFDMGSADFAVFDYIFEPFRYNQGDSIEGYGPAGSTDTYAVPDSVSVLLEIEQDDTYIGRYISTSQEYDDTFSVEVSGGGSYAGFSASASSSYFDHNHLKESQDSAFTEDFHAGRIYRAERRQEMGLSPAFSTDLQSLPTALTDDAQGVYDKFLQKWGTHYLESADFGGFVRMTTSATKSFLETKTNEEVTGDVHAAFTSAVASGSLDVKAVKTDLKDIKETDIEWDSSLVQVGGNELDSTGAWANSLFAAPQPLIGLPTTNPIFNRPVFTPITQLAPAGLQQTMEQALESYLASFAPVGLLGPSAAGRLHPESPAEAGERLGPLRRRRGPRRLLLVDPVRVSDCPSPAWRVLPHALREPTGGHLRDVPAVSAGSAPGCAEQRGVPRQPCGELRRAACRRPDV
jgi:hypothetical protein